MIKRRDVLVFAAMSQFVVLSSAYADPKCLIGKWQADEEVVNLTSTMPELTAGDWNTAGDLLIEIFPSGKVELTYDDYVVHRKTHKGNFSVLLEVRYNGKAEGQISGSSDGRSFSLKYVSDILRSVRQRIDDGEWINAEDEDGTPPHEENGYTFHCEGGELRLSKTEDGPFGGDYTGQFIRVTS